jgi:hypothetical protein
MGRNGWMIDANMTALRLYENTLRHHETFFGFSGFGDQYLSTSTPHLCMAMLE